MPLRDLIAGMHEHLSSQTFQENACETIATFHCVGSAFSRGGFSIAPLVEAGAIAALVAALSAHPGCSGIQISCCDAIAKMAATPEGNVDAVQARAPAALVAVMKAHVGDDYRWVCKAIV